ncbi:MAG: GH3 auxin-responsive promoter family protein [Saprospiraceae bacterium]
MGMISIINHLFKIHLRKYEAELAWHYDRPEALQRATLEQILAANRTTLFATEHGLEDGSIGQSVYANRVPVRSYHELTPYVAMVKKGQANVLTTAAVKALAKTAGTTSGESKYIPVTQEHIFSCQKGSWFTLASLHLHREDLQIFARKNMLIGGGYYGVPEGGVLPVADISALMIQSIPLLLRPFYLPDVYTATLPDYEQKIKQIAPIAAREPSLTMLGGVPTWNLAMYREVLRLAGAEHLLEVWPNLQAYVHGGVSFAPYKAHFQALIPSDRFLYHEIYNASEGYFGVQDQLDKDDLLLILNNGIYYEFIPFIALQQGDRRTIPLEEVSPGVMYALVITNSSGLYRYLIGDVVQFTSVHPYRFRIIGRTQEYINAFGEDLLLDNVESALMQTCQQFSAEVADYTIAPYYMQVGEQGRHQWFVEFAKPPANVSAFAEALDKAMQRENSNYAQKRGNDFAISMLELIPLPKDFFRTWLHDRGKTGGQSKIPRLANHRQFAEDILRRIRPREGKK